MCVCIYQQRQLVLSSLTALLMIQLTPHPQPTCLLMSSCARRASPWKQAVAWCHPTWPEEVRSTHLHLQSSYVRKANSKKELVNPISKSSLKGVSGGLHWTLDQVGLALRLGGGDDGGDNGYKCWGQSGRRFPKSWPAPRPCDTPVSFCTKG